MTPEPNASGSEHYRCDHPGCESRVTEAYRVGLGGMPAFYCALHAPVVDSYRSSVPPEHTVDEERARELAVELEKCWALLPTAEHEFPWCDMAEANSDARELARALLTALSQLDEAREERARLERVLSEIADWHDNPRQMRAHARAALQRSSS